MPLLSIIFIVGSEQARGEVAKALELDAVVRAATDQPALDAWVPVVEDEREADALKAGVAADAGTLLGDVIRTVEVVDLRLAATIHEPV